MWEVWRKERFASSLTVVRQRVAGKQHRVDHHKLDGRAVRADLGKVVEERRVVPAVAVLRVGHFARGVAVVVVVAGGRQ